MADSSSAGPDCALSGGDFAAALVNFINETLPQIHTRLKIRPQVDRQTPLFESGLIDSLAILHLMIVVERLTGRPIPPRMVVMKHFRNVDAICAAFGPVAPESV
jgi:acyl carrier protein